MAGVAEVMTFDEAKERYAGKWLALEVVSEDESGMPEEVRLVAEGDSCADVSRESRGQDDVLIVFAGPIVPAGCEFLFRAGGSAR